jgi:hypothetical protein
MHIAQRAQSFHTHINEEAQVMNGKNQVGKQGLPRRALLAMALAAINFGALAQDLKQIIANSKPRCTHRTRATPKAAAASPSIFPIPSLKAPRTSPGASNCSTREATSCSAGRVSNA